MIIEIEEVGPDNEVIELLATDSVGKAAAAVVRNKAPARFLSPMDVDTSLTVPTMQLALADVRDGKSPRSLIEQRRDGALAIAVVAVDEPAYVLRPLMRAFDAVLPVRVGRTNPAAHLEAAASAIAVCISADHVSMLVDDLYPLFEQAGELSWGEAKGSDVDAITTRALRLAGLGETGRGARIFAHLRLALDELDEGVAALREFLGAIERIASPSKLGWASSKGTPDNQAVSVVVARPQLRMF